jgi:tetratricopeptide (TPR) repeat protein
VGGVRRSARPRFRAGGAGLRAVAERNPDPTRRASIHLAASAENARLRGDPEGARAWAEQALRLDGRNPYAYLVLAEVLAETGEREAALRAVLEAEAGFQAEGLAGRHWRKRTARLRDALEPK